MTRLCFVALSVCCIAGCAGVAAHPDSDVPGEGLGGLRGTEPPEGEVPQDHWSRSPAAVPLMKIGRGVANILKSPFDIPATVVRVSREEDNVGYAVAAGLWEGLENFAVRFGAGVVEILTFPIVNDPDPFYVRELGQPAIPREPEIVP
jgi:putative exosortase-associated protein (TIGR04073 family)